LLCPEEFAEIVPIVIFNVYNGLPKEESENCTKMVNLCAKIRQTAKREDYILLAEF
jgi:hypothetical protein